MQDIAFYGMHALERVDSTAIVVIRPLMVNEKDILFVCTKLPSFTKASILHHLKMRL